MADSRPLSNVTQTIAISALRAQQARMRIVAENLANANSTSATAGGDPYRRQAPIFQPTRIAGGTGYVKLPNVDPLIEALDMKEAQRAYEANLNVIETSRAMEQRTLDLLKK